MSELETAAEEFLKEYFVDWKSIPMMQRLLSDGRVELVNVYAEMFKAGATWLVKEAEKLSFPGYYVETERKTDSWATIKHRSLIDLNNLKALFEREEK